MLFAARTDRSVVTAVALVVVLHAASIAFMLGRRDAAAPVALNSQTIAAELLAPEPVAAPPAIQSTPTPAPPKSSPPVTREKPRVQPKPKSVPLPLAQAPSQHPVEAEPPAAPTTTAPAESSPAPAPAAAAAPAAGKPTMAMNAPKSVSHLDCRIVQPDYPMLSKRRGETGIAYVRFVVGVSGRIENIELQKTSGYSRLDDAALAAMRDSACKPYLENGEPVRAAYTQPFNFSLRD
ncbi:TonB family protein [Paraburkholderia denitrificans]|uniref:TonB family protein n=1 Tax=Paraburkholderia denitrificans TaxID=694025 RepID=A0ABW0JBJ0_9BURK